MKIYIAHPTDMDYENEIYKPLRNDSFFSRHVLIFPHEESSKIINTRDDHRNVDIVIAECSKPSTGVGIELGWFYDDEKPIYCLYKAGTKYSNAVKIVAKEIIEYSNGNDFVNIIKKIIEEQIIYQKKESIELT